MCFPFLFRAALDTRSSQIDETMKMACAKALAQLAREPVPDVIYDIYPYDKGSLKFDANYIIPKPFDPRLIEVLPVAVAQAAVESGAATRPIEDFDAYRAELRSKVVPMKSNDTNEVSFKQKTEKRPRSASPEPAQILELIQEWDLDKQPEPADEEGLTENAKEKEPFFLLY